MSEGDVDQLMGVNVEFFGFEVLACVKGVNSTESNSSEDETEEEVFHGLVGLFVSLLLM